MSSITRVADPGAVGLLRDELALPQSADDLEREERIAVGLDGDAVRELLRQALRPERVLEQLGEILRAESLQVQVRRRATTD